ncbi:type VII secretion-associated serine protease mycosin [Streptomyces sp. NPDC057702]|uniref:type VII secretion-associated serine protease mycosin n=1 Tax=unclassified Streptomyces TaxID=2593676 RepID=UPI0036CCDC4D
MRARRGDPTPRPDAPAGPRRPRTAGAVRRPLARTLAVSGALACLTVLPPAPAGADGIRSQEWALDAIHAPLAWQTTKGAGVTVAVLDTGVDAEHPDLQGQVLPGKDMIGFGARRGDVSWARHGTAMAGIIAGRGHGAGGGDGVVGVAPGVSILPVRVILEEGDPARKRARAARGAALADGIRWAADHGADVINLSLGDDSESAHPERREDAAVQYALRKGVVVVASAGNGGGEGDRVSYPAAYPGVIAVTAVDRYGSRAAFSTRRWYATICAPGVDVVIADPNRRYYQGWGTSAASAFVSGAAALVRSAHPDLSPVQVKRLLTETAQDRPEGGRNDELGAGMVDVAAAIEAGGALEARAQLPSPAAYPDRYFGHGPLPERAAGGQGGGPSTLALSAGLAGAALVLAAVALWRERRVRAPGRRPPTG